MATKLNTTFLAIALIAATPVVAPAQSQESKVRFRNLIKGSTLISMNVMDRQGRLMGHVAEVVVDHKNGYLALFGIRRNSSDEGRLLLVPPVRVRYDSKKHVLHLTQPLETYQSRLSARIDGIDRKQMRAIYSEGGVDPYWKNQYGLVSLDDLDGRVVRGKNRRKIGRIKDVAFAPERHWKVAYIVLTEVGGPTDRLMAVPMGMFNRSQYSTVWTIPASHGRLRALPRFENQWPTEIDRRWIEMTALTESPKFRSTRPEHSDRHNCC